jgi:hypothetical protein
MRGTMRRCLLRKLACQSAARAVEMSLPKDAAKAGTVLDVGCERYRVEQVHHPAPEHRSIIRPYVKDEVIDYLRSIA